MSEVYTNIRQMADRIMRHPLMTELSLESILDYSVDFMQICGVPRMFEEKVANIEISNYRGMLPCDWISTIQVRPVLGSCTQPAMRASTDNFHMAHHRQKSSPDATFKIQGNIIYTSFECGELEMSYKAIATDNEGFPLIPDNSKYMRALEYYIKKEYFNILFDMGKISPQVLINAKQDYSFYVGQAQNEFIKLDLSSAESFFNSWGALLPRGSEFQRGFGTMGTKEYIRVKR